MTAVISRDFIERLPSYSSGTCSYWYDRDSAMHAFRCREKIDPASMDFLLESGFRRCGDLFYRTDCGECSECVSYRVVLNSIVFSRSQKRVLKRNAHISVSKTDPVITEEKEEMYMNYQKYRHHEDSHPLDIDDIMHSMKTQMFSNYGNTMQLDFRNGGKLVGYMTIDEGSHSVSAVYSVYDTSVLSSSPGKFMILGAMEWAKTCFDYFYLGFYIAGNRKMDYKSSFGSAQVLDMRSGKWTEFVPGKKSDF